MPVESADLRIDAQLIVPMSARDVLLRGHSLLIRDGRIVEILPTAKAVERYRVSALVERPTHALIPGLINADAEAAMSLTRVISAADAAATAARLGPEFVYDSVLRAMAEMLKSGITCFLDRFYAPQESAKAAHDQGMRAVIGLPLSQAASPWASDPDEYLSRALKLRDEYRTHPLVSTLFAPLDLGSLSDTTLKRLATLADELEAGISVDVSEPPAPGSAGLSVFQRLSVLGLLTPALSALHPYALDAKDLALAQRTGSGICLSPQLALSHEARAAWLGGASKRQMKIAIAAPGARTLRYDVWNEIRMAAALLQDNDSDGAHDALAAATSGAAAVLGLEDVGTLAPGKWADLCCLDLARPAAFAGHHDLRSLLAGADRDCVSDVWVAGRALLSNRELVRLDWPAVASKAHSWICIAQARGATS